MPTVTVVPADKLIIVDGHSLQFDFPAPEKLHALQWDGQQGHLEWADDMNWSMPMTDLTAYAEEVAPYVAMWRAENARLEQAAAAAKEAYAALPAVKERKRAEINAGFDAAITASVTMPSASSPPSSVELALGIDAFRAEDSEGWNDLLAIQTARRDELLAAVEAAASAEAVQVIIISYAV